jgi:putative ABC transport system substrate-binding protein
MQRREFITLLGGAATAWPLAASAQQPVMPSIGYLSIGSPRPFAHLVAAFLRGLSETGYIEGRNVAIEYRWAAGKNERLPEMAADLVSRRVAVIAVLADIAVSAAKAKTMTIPIVFMTGGDPVREGFVASLNQPGGNITGASWFSVDPMAKRLEILHQVVPNAAVIAQLVDLNFQDSVSHVAEVKEAARNFGLQLVVLVSRTANDIDTAFTSLLQQGAHAIIVGPGSLHLSRREQIVALATNHAIPAIYPFREFAMDGGLISYGNRLQDSFYWSGVYVGRILKGEKPADLPVIRATKFELVINLKTAKALRLETPPTLLATADEVIE